MMYNHTKTILFFALFLLSSLSSASVDILDDVNKIYIEKYGDLYVTETIKINATNTTLYSLTREIPAKNVSISSITRDGNSILFKMTDTPKGGHKLTTISETLPSGNHKYIISYTAHKYLNATEDPIAFKYNITYNNNFYPLKNKTILYLPDNIKSNNILNFKSYANFQGERFASKISSFKNREIHVVSPLSRGQLSIYFEMPYGTILTPPEKHITANIKPFFDNGFVSYFLPYFYYLFTILLLTFLYFSFKHNQKEPSLNKSLKNVSPYTFSILVGLFKPEKYFSSECLFLKNNRNINLIAQSDSLFIEPKSHKCHTLSGTFFLREISKFTSYFNKKISDSELANIYGTKQFNKIKNIFPISLFPSSMEKLILSGIRTNVVSSVKSIDTFNGTNFLSEKIIDLFFYYFGVIFLSIIIDYYHINIGNVSFNLHNNPIIDNLYLIIGGILAILPLAVLKFKRRAKPYSLYQNFVLFLGHFILFSSIILAIGTPKDLIILLSIQLGISTLYFISRTLIRRISTEREYLMEMSRVILNSINNKHDISIDTFVTLIPYAHIIGKGHNFISNVENEVMDGKIFLKDSSKLTINKDIYDTIDKI